VVAGLVRNCKRLYALHISNDRQCEMVEYSPDGYREILEAARQASDEWTEAQKDTVAPKTPLTTIHIGGIRPPASDEEESTLDVSGGRKPRIVWTAGNGAFPESVILRQYRYGMLGGGAPTWTRRE